MYLNKLKISILYVCFGLVMAQTGCTEKNNDTPVSSQQETKDFPTVDEVYRPLVHHFGSTGCTGCGNWGAPVVHRLAEDMGDSILPLITHFKYNDPFITSSSEAIEAAMLKQWYSPQIWINGDDITFEIFGTGIERSVEECKKRLRDSMTIKPQAFVGFNAAMKPDTRYDAEVTVQNVAEDSATYFIEVYSMEDGPVASQAGADPYVATHYKVNRGGFYGDMGKEIKLASGAVFNDSFEIIPCYECVGENLYFYIIVWQQMSSGKYEYVNGKVFFP